MEETVRVARIAPHMWEEPCISGQNGSGTIFFVGCTLRCVYCQNHEISRPKGPVGKSLTLDALADEMLRLQDVCHVHNINIVTASHVLPRVIPALCMAKDRGLVIPVVYNTSGYDSLHALSLLDGLIDIYLPDLKYLSASLAHELSGREDYPSVAIPAIREMVRQTGPVMFDAEEMMTRGTLVRHLVLPGHTKEAIAVLTHLHEAFGDDICISILRQYTPIQDITNDPARLLSPRELCNLARPLTKREYERVIAHALDLGIKNAFLQEEGAVGNQYVPGFGDASSDG